MAALQANPCGPPTRETAPIVRLGPHCDLQLPQLRGQQALSTSVTWKDSAPVGCSWRSGTESASEARRPGDLDVWPWDVSSQTLGTILYQAGLRAVRGCSRPVSRAPNRDGAPLPVWQQ